MSESRGRRSRESRASPLPRRKVPRKMTTDQRRLFRKLLEVLGEIVDGKGRLETDEDAVESILDEADSELKFENNESDGAIAYGKFIQLPVSQETKGDGKRHAPHAAKNIVRFIQLSETHGQVIYHIRSLLNALGGGGRTAEALELMHRAVLQIVGHFKLGNGEVLIYSPGFCAESLDACRSAAEGTKRAFEELGLFNTAFFGMIETLTSQLRVLSAKLDAEYGRCSDCHVEQYLDEMFKPLVRDFESFIRGLSHIAEREIAALRLSQDFLSQRYLNLTTIATFLSSVTATTLQITADDTGSRLLPVTNMMWFISLVFSTSSAIYSLLVMTWRQSSVCQPNWALPSSLYTWFRNAPMYALVGALMTFSIGLCLLSFRVADQQDMFASAVVPTTFAGMNAYAILILTLWFRIELRKWKRSRSAVKFGGDYVILLREVYHKVSIVFQEPGRRTKNQLKKIGRLFSIGGHVVMNYSRDPHLPTDGNDSSDIELASPANGRPDELTRNFTPADISSPSNWDHSMAEPEGSAAIPEKAPAMSRSNSRNETEGVSVDPLGPFESLLRFSPNGRFLAVAHNDTITIYDLNNSCSVLETLKTPGGERIKGISWFPGPVGRLLVKSSQSIFVWKIRDYFERQGTMMGHLREAVTFAQCTTREDAGVEGFICSTGSAIKLFSKECKELRSFNIHQMYNITRIVDASMFRNTYLLCIAEVPDDIYCSRLLVVNLREKSIQSAHWILRGHTSMTVSPSSKKILLHGSKVGAQMGELLITESVEGLTVDVEKIIYLQWWTNVDHQLYRPERTVVFHGHQDKMIVGYSGGEIVALYGDFLLSALHIFTTPTVAAMPQRPVSFAVNAGSESEPYMFAFGDESGSVTIWSVQSNTELETCRTVETFEVYDRRGGRSAHPTISTGRFVTLPLPSNRTYVG